MENPLDKSRRYKNVRERSQLPIVTHPDAILGLISLCEQRRNVRVLSILFIQWTLVQIPLNQDLVNIDRIGDKNKVRGCEVN